MQMVTTEDSRNYAVDVIRNNAMLSTRVRYLLSDTFSSSKRIAKYVSYDKLRYTSPSQDTI